jgi:beta-N-acetylhexosaminidase
LTPRALAALALGLLLAACAGTAHPPSPASTPGDEAEVWAQRTLRTLSLEQKVGQLFVIWLRSRFMNTLDPDYLALVDAMHRYGVGGLALSVPVEGPLLVRSRPEEAALLLNRLQRESQLPLLVAADFETGVASRLSGATGFPQAMAFGAAADTSGVRLFGRITGAEARAIGVHWNFFPVADVNSNPANPVINTRSFGEDPARVSDFVAAYIEGAHEAGMLATAKHFPGHGDTDTDSHFGVARVPGDLAHLETLELPPFRRAIAAGVDAIMVAHLTVPAVEPSPDEVATTSRAVVTGLLKEKLGFRGLVVTDALDMAALTRRYASDVGQAAVAAFEAGNDVLLIPADLGASWRAVIAAVRDGEIPAVRLDQSVLKILRLKARLGLPRHRLVDVARVPEIVGRPENLQQAQDMADEGVTLVRDEAGLLPLPREMAEPAALPYLTTVETRDRLVALVLAADVRAEAGRVFERDLKERVPDAHVFVADAASAAGVSPELLDAAARAERVVVAAFASPSPGQGPAGSGPSDPTAQLLQDLLTRAGEKTVVVAVGSPYVAQPFPSIRTYLCTLSSAPVSETSAVRALFGEIAIRGRLPVTIPGIAARGSGIPRDAAGAPPS